jgi:hypothetical protein
MKFEKLRAKMLDIVAKSANAKSVSIGWNAESTYGADRGGQFVAAVAVMNEYGGTITIPEHTQTINRNMKANGEFGRGGRFVKAASKAANFQTTATVPEHDVTIPARPFFRTLVAAKRMDWIGRLGIAAHENNYNAHKTLDIVGESIKNDLKDAIRDFKSPGNAPSTIARKGFDNPLIEDGTMMETANHWVNE